MPEQPCFQVRAVFAEGYSTVALKMSALLSDRALFAHRALV
jgi:hypothetical protein